MNAITHLDFAGIKKQVQRAHAGGVVMIFSGEHDLACKEHLRSDLARLSAVKDAVLDFTDVTYIDSTVIVELIRLHSRRSASGHNPMTIVVQQAYLKKLFALLSLESIFRFNDSLDEAIQKDKEAFRLDYSSCGFQSSWPPIRIEFDRRAH